MTTIALHFYSQVKCLPRAIIALERKGLHLTYYLHSYGLSQRDKFIVICPELSLIVVVKLLHSRNPLNPKLMWMVCYYYYYY